MCSNLETTGLRRLFMLCTYIFLFHLFAANCMSYGEAEKGAQCIPMMQYTPHVVR